MEWRPITGIRANGDADWTPLLVTRPRVSAGPPDPHRRGVERTYRDFDAIADEVVNARVWAGVHRRRSSEVGRALRDRIGHDVLRRPGRR
jgi:hypothetical protein